MPGFSYNIAELHNIIKIQKRELEELRKFKAEVFKVLDETIAECEMYVQTEVVAGNEWKLVCERRGYAVAVAIKERIERVLGDDNS